MVVNKIRHSSFMNTRTIPYQNYMTAIIAVQQTKKPYQVEGIRIFRQQMEEE